YGVADATNTVMGPAVSDAAAWYDKADWIGIKATPHASIFVQSVLERFPRKSEQFLVDYHVPIKGAQPIRVKTINWPKAFYVSGLRPSGGGSARAMLLEFLAKHFVPKGTEAKYFNTIAFFDH